MSCLKIETITSSPLKMHVPIPFQEDIHHFNWIEYLKMRKSEDFLIAENRDNFNHQIELEAKEFFILNQRNKAIINDLDLRLMVSLLRKKKISI